MVDKTGVIILARMESKRLPNKVVQKICGTETIKILIENVKHAKLPIVLAIPKTKINDKLADIADREEIPVYRGQDDSPTHRMAEVCRLYDFENIIRITADNILIDSSVMRTQLNFHIKGNNDFTYCTRILQGAQVQIIKTSALLEIAEKHDKPIEFITYFLRNTNKYRALEFYPHHDFWFNFRCTLDYYEDLQLLRHIFNALGYPYNKPGVLSIINYLKNNRELLTINHVPKITVYVVNYNYDKYIIECLDSIIKQTFQDFELLVYDDFSEDESSNKILEWYSGLELDLRKKVILCRNDKNLGLPATCNKALVSAKGDYIIRVDSDDKLLDKALEQMLENIGDSYALVSGYLEADKDMIVQKEVRENEYHPGCTLMNRQAANTIKFREGLNYFEGIAFWQSFLEYYNMKFFEEPCWIYRKHEEQKTNKKNIVARKKTLKKILSTTVGKTDA